MIAQKIIKIWLEKNTYLDRTLQVDILAIFSEYNSSYCSTILFYNNKIWP